MKSTGVVRRIDELGRIVIPKEIRKSFRIKEGESLEIFIDDNETISLKKYSTLNKFSELADIVVRTLSQITNKNIGITDTNNVIKYNGKEKYLKQNLSNDFLNILSDRKKVIQNKLSKIIITSEQIEKYFILIPLIVNSDLIGSIFLLSDEVMSKTDEFLVDFAAKILTNYVEQ